MTAPAAIVTPLTPRAAAGGLKKSAVVGGPADIQLLTAGLAARDEEAFRRFHAEYFDRLLRYLLVVTGGDEDAARDALQETFIRVVRHARPFDAEGIFWSWLTVLARSAATDAKRKRHRYWRLLASYAAAWIFRPGATTQDDTDELLQIALQRQIATLDAGDRVLIEGKYLRGASVRDLAGEFGLTERAIESRLARARRQLREQLLNSLKHETAD